MTRNGTTFADCAERPDMFPNLAAKRGKWTLHDRAGNQIGPVFQYVSDAIDWRWLNGNKDIFPQEH